MGKTILLTGATDGIGLEAAKMLAKQGHHLLLHGRNSEKLDRVSTSLPVTGAPPETYIADLSRMSDVEALARAIAGKHDKLDVLINNAGILKTADSETQDGFDVRFAVNTFAPYLLTKGLLHLMGPASRVINLSSAAQATVDLAALVGKPHLPDMAAYSQSKLAITMWTRAMAEAHPDGPVFLAVNPGSLLASKMVKEGFGIAGSDLSIGAGILCRAALDEAFATSSGLYFDNDKGDFGPPHADAMDDAKVRGFMQAMTRALGDIPGLTLPD